MIISDNNIFVRMFTKLKNYIDDNMVKADSLHVNPLTGRLYHEENSDIRIFKLDDKGHLTVDWKHTSS